MGSRLPHVFSGLASIAVSIAVSFAAACGGALDREDGAVRIHLAGLPATADTVEVSIFAGGRTFGGRLPRPIDNIISSFTAIPTGTATIAVVLFAATRPLASRAGLIVEIARDQTSDIVAQFSGTPPEAVVTGPADTTLHHVGDGAIEIIVSASDPFVPLDVHVRANGVDVAVVERAMGVFAAEIDPHLAGTILPAQLLIEIDTCPRGDRLSCKHDTRTLTIHRTAWSASFGSVARARPALSSLTGGFAVSGDRLGKLHIIDVTTGADAFPPLSFAAPISSATAIADDLAVFADGAGKVHAVALGTGMEDTSWNVELGAPPPTGAVFDGARVVIGAGTRVVAVDHSDGTFRVLATLPDEIRADPLADGRGVVAVDRSGHIVALDAAGATVFTASVAGSVRAPPVRDDDGAGVVIATESGSVIRFDAVGRRIGPQSIELDAPIVHRPIFTDGRLVIAAGVHVAFISGGVATRHRVGAAITGAPEPWPDSSGAVAVGLQNGLVLVVSPDGSRKPISRMSGSALSPVVLDAPRRVLVPGSTGILEMLRLEEGF